MFAQSKALASLFVCAIINHSSAKEVVVAVFLKAVAFLSTPPISRPSIPQVVTNYKVIRPVRHGSSTPDTPVECSRLSSSRGGA